MDKKILASLMVIGLVATLAGAGIYAYFSDTETAKIEFATGDMNLQLATGTRAGATGTWEDGDTLEITGPTNWDEDEEYKVVIWFRNTGSLGATFLYREYFDYWDSDAGGFLDAVQLVSVYEYYDGAWDTTDWVNGSTDGTISSWGWVRTNDDDGVGDSDDYLMLWELINMKIGKYDEKCYDYASVVDGFPTKDYLPPGGYVAVEYTFKLMGEKTTNDLQGEEFRFSIRCHMTNENIETYPGPV